MRRWNRFALGALVGALAFVGVVRADDPPMPSPAPVPSDRELRLYHVGALTWASPDYVIDRGPYAADVDEPTCDAEEGTPGPGERADRQARLGGIDDVIELVKSALGFEDPTSFTREGDSIAANGSRIIAVSGSRSLHERVAAVLAGFERRDLPTVTIDVLALRGEAAAARDGGLTHAVARGTLVPLAGARAVGFSPRTITARSGSERAYVQDEDVEVAENAKATDPKIGVAQGGIAFEAALARATAEHVNVQLHAWWAGVSSPQLVMLQPSGDPVETFVIDGRRVDAVLDLTPGVWSVLAGGGDVLFAVRASVRPHDTPFASATVVPMSATLPKAPFSAHWLDVRDLAIKSVSVRGESPMLVPRFAPPALPELPEPAPAFPSDALIETIKAFAPVAWGPEGTSIDVKNGMLALVTDDATARATGEFLDGIRLGLGRSARVRATVVSLPLASFPEYLTSLDDGASLFSDGGKALLARAGASILDRGGVLVRPGQRLASVGGARHTWVGDYDVKISKGAVIGQPVMSSVLAGFSFDIDSRLVAGGAAVACDLRIDRSTWGGSRRLKTSYGELECPTLGVSRIRGGTVIPLGSQRIVGATFDAGIVTLTILSAFPD